MTNIPLEKRLIEVILKWIKKRGLSGSEYIEVGCGDGLNIEAFSKLGMNGTGIDISDEALKVLRLKNFPKTKVIKADFLKYKKHAKLIFMLNFLEHVPNDDEFLKKAYLQLKPGGFLIIAVPTNPKVYGYSDKLAGHIKRYDEYQIRKKIKAAGFKIVDSKNIGFPVENMYKKVFNLLYKNKKVESKNFQSGIQYKKGYYPGMFDSLAKMAFPILTVLIRVDFLFHKTKLGNNLILFCKKV